MPPQKDISRKKPKEITTPTGPLPKEELYAKMEPLTDFSSKMELKEM